MLLEFECLVVKDVRNVILGLLSVLGVRHRHWEQPRAQNSTANDEKNVCFSCFFNFSKVGPDQKKKSDRPLPRTIKVGPTAGPESDNDLTGSSGYA